MSRMSDLERTLRTGEYGEVYGPSPLETQAADRIAELEAALLEAIEWIEADPICSADTDVARSLRKALRK